MSNDTTYDRILNTASDVFCEKGFDNTTVRDICEAADANVAAVNYHFGDKQKLYLKVLAKWMSEFMEQSEATKGITADSTLEERMRAYVRSELKGLCVYDDPSGVRRERIRLLLREVTGDHHDHEVFECHMEEEQKVLVPIVRELLGAIDDEEVLKQANEAASGMLTHYFLMLVHHPETGLQSEEDLDSMTDFLTAFILGGLTSIKEKYNA